LKSILLWLFVINLGIAFGAGLYEARVVIPQWANLPPKDWPNTGLLFWVYVTTVPLTLLALANLIAAWLDKSVKRKWWLGAVFIVLIERLITFSYFIPTVVNLTNSDLPQAETGARLSQWLFFNHGRHLLTLAAWLMALKALSLPSTIEIKDRKSTK
jgi:protein-S-isoprenylcysteine O-methyltransferase Ste14